MMAFSSLCQECFCCDDVEQQTRLSWSSRDHANRVPEGKEEDHPRLSLSDGFDLLWSKFPLETIRF